MINKHKTSNLGLFFSLNYLPTEKKTCNFLFNQKVGEGALCVTYPVSLSQILE